MGKIYKWSVIAIAVFTSVFGTNCYSQNVATPNPGFENWTQVGNHFDPNNWNTLNPSTSILGVFTCVRAMPPDVHAGSYGIKLTTKSVFGITANGIASTATLITTPPYGVSGGLPYTQRPDSITGWYKYTPGSPSDSGFVQFILLGTANDTIGIARFNSPNLAVNSVTRFSAPFNYASAATPSLSYWIISSSDGVNPVVGSSIIVDDINLIFNSSGIPETTSQSQFHLTSNLIENTIEVENHTGEVGKLVIYDSSGRMVSVLDVNRGLGTYELQNFKTGFYLYKFWQAGIENSFYGKLIKK